MWAEFVVASVAFLQEVFLRVLRLSPLLKNRHFEISIRPRKVDEEPLCGCATPRSLFIYLFFFRMLS